MDDNTAMVIVGLAVIAAMTIMTCYGIYKQSKEQ